MVSGAAPRCSTPIALIICTFEGYWSIVKRGIMGTFYKVSKKYLPLYVNEFEFPYNNRNNPDIFDAAIRAC
jgi:hypothetical protein